MPETLEDFLMARPPTAELPLLGQTILAVEDSRVASDALRLICQRSGARLRRADCLAAAERHLRCYRPAIVLVDIGLPDGSGLDLIRTLDRAEPRVDAIFAMSGDDALASGALMAGADGFLEKPISSVTKFQRRMLDALAPGARPVSIDPMDRETLQPDRIAMSDDLMRLVGALRAPSPESLGYVAQFLHGLAKSDHGEVVQDAAMMAETLHRDGGSEADVEALRDLLESLAGRGEEQDHLSLKSG